MNTETELIDMALAVSAASGSVADAVKKAIFHNHGIDWPLLLTLAEVLRVNAAILALLAEQQIDAQQAAEDAAEVVTMPMWFTNDLTAQWIAREIDAQGLSNVTLGPATEAAND